MAQTRAKLNQNGRLVIPAPYRHALGLNPGDEVVLTLEGDELRLASVKSALRRARRLIREHIPAGKDLTQSIIDDRRKAARRE